MPGHPLLSRLCRVLLLALVGVLLIPVATAGAASTAVWLTVYRLSGAQTTLTQVTSTGPEDVWSVGTITASDGYARPAAWHTDHGTTTRLLLNRDWSATWGQFSGVDGVADNDMWAAGVITTKNSGLGTPLAAHWDGTAWTQVALPLPAGSTGALIGVAARSASDVYLAGTLDGITPAVLFHWDGTTMTQVPVDITDPSCFAATARVTAVTATSTAVWLGLNCTLTTDARQEGSVQRLAGGTWSLAVALPPSSGIIGLADDGNGTVWAVGTESVVGGFASVVLAGRSTLRLVSSFGEGVLFWSVAARGSDVYLVGQVSVRNQPLVRKLVGNSWLPETVRGGDMPLFGVTVDSAGTAWTVGPAFGGSFGTPHAGLWRRTTGT